MGFTPFLDGRRKCLGYNLADLNMRLLIGTIIRNFDMEMDQSHPIRFEFVAVYGVQSPMIKLRVR